MTTGEALNVLRDMKEICDQCKSTKWRDALETAIEALELIEMLEDDGK